MIALNNLFRDHAVLQAGRALPVWGRARPGEEVSVRLGKAEARMPANDRGDFRVHLPPLEYGGPFSLSVACAGEEVVVRDVWIGEVWLCSGQSNMQMTLDACGVREDVASADDSRIRVYEVPRLADACRRYDSDGRWEVCTPAVAGAFSAAAYHFAVRVRKELGVAVGLVVSAWGGTPIEAWASREALSEFSDTLAELERMDLDSNRPDFESPPFSCPADPGNGAEALGWAEPEFDDSRWAEMNLPSSWQAAGHDCSGVFWFRRRVELPESWAGRDLTLGIGAVDKQDVTYVNGRRVGSTGQGMDDSLWNVPRVYAAPGELGKEGAITVAVRAYSFCFGGGMIGPADAMWVRPAETDPSEAIPLSGPWRYAVEHDFGVVDVPNPPPGPGNPRTPGILYDNMIAPLLPYAIRGALWYQGESNATDGINARRYERLQRAMIRDWRRAWGQGDFDFIMTQIANFRAPSEHQRESLWARVREAHLRVLDLPATGLAVTIDIGEVDDIHPRNKREVGRRLARWALSRTYRRGGVPSGPLYDGMRIEGAAIRIFFRHAERGLVSDGEPGPFVMAGGARRFFKARARIEGDTVRVFCPEVTSPCAVRYAWADNPAGNLLRNAEGLPASPFRTDTW